MVSLGGEWLSFQSLVEHPGQGPASLLKLATMPSTIHTSYEDSNDEPPIALNRRTRQRQTRLTQLDVEFRRRMGWELDGFENIHSALAPRLRARPTGIEEEEAEERSSGEDSNLAPSKSWAMVQSAPPPVLPATDESPALRRCTISVSMEKFEVTDAKWLSALRSSSSHKETFFVIHSRIAHPSTSSAKSGRAHLHSGTALRCWRQVCELISILNHTHPGIFLPVVSTDECTNTRELGAKHLAKVELLCQCLQRHAVDLQHSAAVITFLLEPDFAHADHAMGTIKQWITMIESDEQRQIDLLGAKKSSGWFSSIFSSGAKQQPSSVPPASPRTVAQRRPLIPDSAEESLISLLQRQDKLDGPVQAAAQATAEVSQSIQEVQEALVDVIQAVFEAKGALHLPSNPYAPVWLEDRQEEADATKELQKESLEMASVCNIASEHWCGGLSLFRNMETAMANAAVVTRGNSFASRRKATILHRIHAVEKHMETAPPPVWQLATGLADRLIRDDQGNDDREVTRKILQDSIYSSCVFYLSASREVTEAFPKALLTLHAPAAIAEPDEASKKIALLDPSVSPTRLTLTPSQTETPSRPEANHHVDVVDHQTKDETHEASDDRQENEGEN